MRLRLFRVGGPVCVPDGSRRPAGLLAPSPWTAVPATDGAVRP
jgi:hypothetical protein